MGKAGSGSGKRAKLAGGGQGSVPPAKRGRGGTGAGAAAGAGADEGGDGGGGETREEKDAAARMQRVTDAFARRLASNQGEVRAKSMAALREWLESREGEDFSFTDAMRLWKGLFYAMWHSDKMKPQQELAGLLATLGCDMEEGAGWTYTQAGILTMCREWMGIDHLRMEKFFSLARYLVRAWMEAMCRGGAPEGMVARWRSLLLVCAAIENCEDGRGSTLIPTDFTTCSGFILHIADVYFEELVQVLDEFPDEEGGGTAAGGAGAKKGRGGGKKGAGVKAAKATGRFSRLVEPWVTIMGMSTDKRLVERIKAEIFDQLYAAALQAAATHEGAGEKDEDDDVGEDDSDDGDELVVEPAELRRRCDECLALLVDRAGEEDTINRAPCAAAAQALRSVLSGDWGR